MDENRQKLERPLRILLYALDRRVRDQVRAGVGPRLAAEGPEIEWVEVATGPIVLDKVHRESFDLLILDGEAPKYGGMGLIRQIKDEIYEAPPAVVLIGRRDDQWLASWSLAEAVVPYPIDPFVIHRAVVKVLGGTVPR